MSSIVRAREQGTRPRSLASAFELVQDAAAQQTRPVEGMRAPPHLLPHEYAANLAVSDPPDRLLPIHLIRASSQPNCARSPDLVRIRARASSAGLEEGPRANGVRRRSCITLLPIRSTVSQLGVARYGRSLLLPVALTPVAAHHIETDHGRSRTIEVGARGLCVSHRKEQVRTPHRIPSPKSTSSDMRSAVLSAIVYPSVHLPPSRMQRLPAHTSRSRPPQACPVLALAVVVPPPIHRATNPPPAHLGWMRSTSRHPHQ
ncbi:hypothetical protein C8R44DRAFT_891409 [Mycena epipterygia]|nr:hypothetical protein C8R44DRAFT_891409 [Mycena epipterygia]